ncbi:DEAD/DEAH box helicase [Streptomyces scabiei]|uniref:DEAD/DEAH box helicase n=1 Tax=Streptomyces scabiei TaxID=1930 RepID=UPI0004E615B1|nr:DEAD/DEAH box helicase [Streptomyces scabiei]KFG07533.1 DEAD/DEAH box helicase [Streptomyces scabiei]MDX3679475.1 DEAD/DEAH box helicase [Streptomyces scabiei]
MTSTFTPRPYQLDAIEALRQGWAAGQNRVAVVLPTGAGKTVVFSHLAHQMLDQLDGRRVLVIAHREELIEQAASKLLAVDPMLRVGIVKAQRDDHHDADVIVASVQTLAVAKRREAIRDIGLIIVDECHHAAARTYMEVLEHFGAWRGVPTAGFTATMTRTDGGLAEVWEDVVFRLDILDMIGDGYLCDVRGKAITVDTLDLNKVKTRGGDLVEGQLGKALEDSGALDAIAKAYVDHAGDRAGVVFTPTVATAQQAAAALEAVGIKAAPVWGDMGRDERRATLARYAAGEVQVLTNCMVLTEGFDAPHTSCIVVARPTKSPGLYVQMVGRGLRPAPGKRDALLLDVMGAASRHKLASMVDLTEREIGEAEEGKSLKQVAEEHVANEKRRVLAARVDAEEINLFGSSAIRWLRTEDGTWFIRLTGAMFLFLVRDPGTRLYRMRRWTEATGVQPPKDDTARPLPEALAWLEQQAKVLAPRAFVTKQASWRRGQPSPKQFGLCRRLGIAVPRGSTAGEVADLIDQDRVGRVLGQLILPAAA